MKTPKGAALITGASSGIGATYADRLARRGHDLVLVARDKVRLEALAAKLRAQTGVTIDVLPADLTDRADRLAVEQRLAADERIEILINNAGVGMPGTLAEGDLDRLEAMIALNVTAVSRLAAVAAKAFSARATGAIINIASILALAPEISGAGYAGAKAYVLNLTQKLALEVGAAGVQVQAVLPGATHTEIWERAGTDISQFPPGVMMGVDEMVDAALAGFDRGELITIPSLPDPADWEAFNAARLALGPNLSKDRAAARYKVPTPA
ncbi:MAG: SDR family oxidoreductase [Phenylobacterium sp.]|uniref:SDR family NAD(P)-dependent oxidoreductase n=1 Tax=Phenylobacterium sp. TaxID=1871053 RepID=UPI001B77EC2F|nr:SDR family oxidoreductase [Phenylobacterium sp.]MBP7815474.1 SDR family oxidoreductase [Phenylobacterium sp.]MBP9756836.1 SDR family oxidoreductase [Phenylobacterium sp.]